MTALSLFINKVEYNEVLICDIISCYKTLNSVLRIYHHAASCLPLFFLRHPFYLLAFPDTGGGRLCPDHRILCAKGSGWPRVELPVIVLVLGSKLTRLPYELCISSGLDFRVLTGRGFVSH